MNLAPLKHKNSFLKIGSKEIQTTIEPETAEVLDVNQKNNYYLANSKEEFFLIYTSLIGIFQEMTMPEVKVYCYLLQNYNIGTDIALPKGMKEIIAKKQGLGLGTVNNALSKLSAKKLIYSIHTAIYKINPRYAFKGSTSNRNQSLKFILEVECKDC